MVVVVVVVVVVVLRYENDSVDADRSIRVQVTENEAN